MYKDSRASKLTRSVEHMYVSVDNMSKSCCFAFVFAVICLSLEADAQPTVDETMTCSSSTLEDVVNKIASIQQQNVMEIKDEIRDVKTQLVSGCGETNETRLEDVVKEIKAEIRDEIRDVKTLLVSRDEKTNETRLEEVVNMVRIVASNQQENAKEISDVKALLVSGNGENNETRLEDVVREIRDEIRDVKEAIAPGSEENNETRLEEVVREIKDVSKDVKKLLESATATVEPSKQALVSALVCEYLVRFPFQLLLLI